jgi:hypothetical protein
VGGIAAYNRRKIDLLGLSLTTLLPAAAWFFIFIVCRFFAPQGEKTTYEELNMTGPRKSYR